MILSHVILKAIDGSMSTFITTPGVYNVFENSENVVEDIRHVHNDTIDYEVLYNMESKTM